MRIDSGVVEGDTVTIFYDPMIAKLIVHDADRPRALARLRDALAQCEIAGPKSNIEFLERLVRHPADRRRHASTPATWIAISTNSCRRRDSATADLLLAAATAQLLAQEAAAREAAAASTDPTSPWAIADGWRLGHAGKRDLAFLHRGERLVLAAHGSGGDYRIEHDGATPRVAGARLADERSERALRRRRPSFHVDLDAAAHRASTTAQRRLRLEPVAVYRPDAARPTPAAATACSRRCPGRVVLVKASPGDSVRGRPGGAGDRSDEDGTEPQGAARRRASPKCARPPAISSKPMRCS